MFPSSKSLRSVLRQSLAAFLPAGPGRRQRLRNHRGVVEQLEVRQLLTGDFDSAFKFGGVGNDEAAAIAIDNAGNTFTAGFFSGTVDLDPGAGTQFATSVGGTDIFLSKFDASGALVWAKTFGGVEADEAESIAVDGSGNVLVTGFFSRTIDLDPGPALLNRTSLGSTDIFISKFSQTGTLIWGHAIGGGRADEGRGIAVDPLGAVYTAGFFGATTDFDPGANVWSLTNTSNSSDIFVSKLDASGIFVYARQAGSTGADQANGIAVDAAGSVTLAGSFTGTVNFGPAFGSHGAIHLKISVCIKKAALGSSLERWSM